MTSYTQIIADTQHCARLFRLGRDIEAALKMVDLIDIALPLSTRFSPEQKAKWTHVLNEILSCQERQDWLGVADWLDVEFVTLCQD